MKKWAFLTFVLFMCFSCKEEPYENPVVKFSPVVTGSVVGSEIVASASANPVVLSPGSPGAKFYYSWEISFEYENLNTDKRGFSNEQAYGESATAAKAINGTDQAFIQGDSIMCKITALLSVTAKEGNDNLVKLAQGTVNTSIVFICPEVVE